MAAWQWTEPGQSGDWASPDWTGDGTQSAGQTYPDGPTDTAQIGNSISDIPAYTVTVGSGDDISIEAVTLADSVATLQIDGGSTFNAGAITIDPGATFSAGAGATFSFGNLVINGGSVTDMASGTNTGTIAIAISGSDYGDFITGGMLTNAGNGLIGINGGGLLENTGSLINDGTITDNDNGNLTNASGAVLTNNGIIANNGSFVGGALFAGILYNDGDLINAAAGELNNSGGIDDQTGGIIENDGAFTNVGLVTVSAGAAVTGSGAYTQDSGTTTVSGSFAQSSVLVQGGILNLTGGTTQSESTEIGSAAVLSGYGSISGLLANAGIVTASGGKLAIVGAVTGAGAASIAAASTLELGGSDAQDVSFLASTGTLQLDLPAGFSGVLDGIVAGDVIHLPDVATAGVTASLNGQNLIVSRNAAPLFTFELGSTFTGEGFNVVPDATVGTDIVVTSSPTDEWLRGNANWSTTGDWSLGVPTATTAAAINPQSPATVTVPAGYSATAASLAVGADDQVVVDGTLTVGGSLVLAQANGLSISGSRAPSQTTDISAGTIAIEGGSYVDDIVGNATITSQSLFNNGTYTFFVSQPGLGATVTIDGNITGTGTLALGDVGSSHPGPGGPVTPMTLTLSGTDSDTILFLNGVDETLTLDDPGGFTGALAGLEAGDVISLPSVPSAGATASLQGTDLVVSENGVPAYTFALSSTFSGESFSVKAVGGGVDLTVVSGRPTGSVDQWFGRSANWGTASDWSLGVPTSTIAADINPVLAATVTVPSGYNASAASLTVSAGSQITDVGTLTISGTLALAQANGLSISGTRTSTQSADITAGSITISAGSYVDDIIGNATISSQSLVNDGTYSFFVPQGGFGAAVTIDGSITGTGTLALGDIGPAHPGPGGPLTSISLALGGADNNAISFLDGVYETLILDDPGGFAGVLQGLAPSDFIDLPGVAPTGTSASLQGNDLVISENGMPGFTFALDSTFAGESFRVTALRGGGSEISVIKT